VVSLTVIFWIFIFLFAIIGAMRGWAKELLVTFSVILAIFIMTILITYIPIVKSMAKSGGTAIFWLEITILFMCVFFGYQTPNIRAIAGARFARERLQDTLLGFLLGAINGYLIVGTFWWILAEAKYPYNLATPPIPGTPLGDAALRILQYAPPEWLVIPWIYFAVMVSFIFVIIVFL
jgi:CDP-diglyceride synthetase